MKGFLLWIAEGVCFIKSFIFKVNNTEAKTWRYWPNIGCYNFNFERTVFFELTNDAIVLSPVSGSELRKSQKEIMTQILSKATANSVASYSYVQLS